MINDFYKKAIIKATEYSGNKSVGKKILSASSITNDDLVLILKYKHGSVESDEFGQNTIGSLYQLGVDDAFKNIDNVDTALRLEHSIPSTDWVLSGEIDQLVHLEHDGVMHHYIVDNKLVKHKTKTDVLKDGMHSYVLQLNAYRWLLHKNEVINDCEPVHLVLAFAYKDGTLFAKEEIPNFELVNIDLMMMDNETFESIIIEKANHLESFLSLDTTPPECSTKFWNMSKKKTTGKAVPERCVRNWCGVADYCPYFQKGKKHRERTAIKNLLNKL